MSIVAPPAAPPRTHQALYRRWRAQTFGEIVGQEPVVQTLRNAVRSNQVAHALLFVGPRGTGKTSMARIVAKALNCTNLVDGEPDDTCEACVSIREGRALDVIEMDAASNNKVDDIRDFLPRVATVPTSLNRKVFIVDEVQRIKEGWDLLLKTLEEPPDHVAFIFCTTDASQVRPAVLSRIQRFDFRPLTVPQIDGKLRRVLAAEGRAADDDAIELVARLAAGGMRDAESMLDQLLTTGVDRLTADGIRELLGMADASTVDAFIQALIARDARTGMRLLQLLEDHGRDHRAFLNQVVEALRDALVAQLTDGSRAAAPEALAAAARRLTSIDPSYMGPGGLRFQLELALLEPSPTAPVAQPSVAVERTANVATRPAPTPAAAEPPPSDPSPGRRQTPGPPAPDRERSAPTAPDHALSGAAARPSAFAPSAPTPSSAAPSSATPAASSPASASATSANSAPSSPSAPSAPAPSAPAPSAPAPSAPSARSAPRAPSTAAPPSDALVDLHRKWPDIVAWIAHKNPASKPLITACRPIAIDGNVVTLGFPEHQAFLKDVAERRRPLLEEGVGQFLGRVVAVRCVAANLEAIAADPDNQNLLDKAREIFADDLVDIGEVSDLGGSVRAAGRDPADLSALVGRAHANRSHTMNAGNLQRLQQQMMQELGRIQEELKTATVEGSAGGGVVKATATGEQKLVSVTIDPSAVDPSDVEMLQDLIVAAVNDAMVASKQLAESKMSALTGGLKLPGM